MTLGKLLDTAEPPYWHLQAQGIMLSLPCPHPLICILPFQTPVPSPSAGFPSTGRCLWLSLADCLWTLEPLASPFLTGVPGTLCPPAGPLAFRGQAGPAAWKISYLAFRLNTFWNPGISSAPQTTAGMVPEVSALLDVSPSLSFFSHFLTNCLGECTPQSHLHMISSQDLLLQNPTKLVQPAVQS